MEEWLRDLRILFDTMNGNHFAIYGCEHQPVKLDWGSPLNRTCAKCRLAMAG